jgi:hypothetical protein
MMVLILPFYVNRVGEGGPLRLQVEVAIGVGGALSSFSLPS